MLSKYLRTTVVKCNYSKTFSEDNENTTHFGFQTIEKSEKTKKGTPSFILLCTNS